MYKLARIWRQISKKHWCLPSLLLLYLILHSGLFTLNYFAADDYLQRAYLLESPALREAGLLQGIEVGDLPFFLNNQFNFFDPATGNDAAMRAYGALPWWTQDGALLHLWRPLSSLSHWLDYQWWPNGPAGMQLHNAVLLVLAFVLGVGLLRSLIPSRPAFLLAVLIYMLDLSVFMVSSWIAARNSLLVACWLPLCLWFYHKANGQAGYYLLALLVYGLALLSAESAIVIAAYLGAYALAYQRGSLRARLLALLPFVVLTLLWRWYYQQAGFGALHISQYLDPGRSPLLFMGHLLQQYPLLLLETLLGIDSLDMLLPLSARPVLAIGGWGLFGLLGWLSWRQAARQPLLGFWFLALVLSLLPGVTLTVSDPRTVFHSHLAFAGWLACFLYDFTKHNGIYQGGMRRLTAVVLWFFLMVQILLQFAGVVILNGLAQFTPTFHPAQFDQKLYGFAELVRPEQHLVLFNHPDVFRLMYFPYQQALQGKAIPKSVRLLDLAETPITVTRVAPNRYRISPEGGFVLHGNDLQQLPAALAGQAQKAGMAIQYAGFFHDGKYDYQPGDEVRFDELVLQIRQLTADGRPQQLDMTLKTDKSHYALVYWDWQKRRYQRLPRLAIGASVTLPGPQ